VKYNLCGFGLVALLLLFCGYFPVHAQSFHKYRNAAGRDVYVTSPDLIPPQYRKKKRAVDLSHVSANQEIGTELTKTSKAELKRISASSMCEEAQSEASLPWYAFIWKRYSVLVVIAFAACLLLGFAPMLTRRIGLDASRRIIAISLPLLLILGAVSFGAIRTSRMMNEVKDLGSLCSSASDGTLAPGVAGKLMMKYKKHIDTYDNLTRSRLNSEGLGVP